MRPNKNIGPAMRKRRKMCLEIAENIILRVQRKHGRAAADVFDADDLALEIETSLPLMYDEAQEEWDRQCAEEDKRTAHRPRKPSVMDRLRAVLGLTGERLDLMQVVEAAIERLEKRKTA